MSDDMDVVSVRLPLTRAQIAALDLLVDETESKTRTGYIWGLVTCSLNDRIDDNACTMRGNDTGVVQEVRNQGA